MNILVTSAHYHLSDKYGSEALWGVEILNRYAKLGHKVFAVAGVAELSTPLESGIVLYKLATSRSKNPLVEVTRKATYPFYSYFRARKIYQELGGDFDIVHHIAPTGSVSYDLFFIFRPLKSKARFVIGPAMIPGENFGSRSFARILGTNNSLVVALLWQITQLLTPVLSFIFRLTVRKADKLIAVTSEAKEYYSKFISPSKIAVIPVGVNLERFGRSSERRVSKKPVILAVAYLIYRKGIDLLIQAIANLYYQKKVKNFRVVVVGTGDEESELKKLANRLKVSKIVKFVGFVPNEKIGRFYKKADIFCSPTRYEPYGITLVEAMAAGLPVVATDVNAVKELVGKAGLFFAKDDVQGLTDKLFILLTQPDLRQRLARQALVRAKNLYSWDKIVEEYTRL